jgi:hypothetical protein
MTAKVSISVSPETDAKLRRLSILAGSVDAALSRLIDYWEQGNSLPNPAPKKEQVMWRSASGDTLPVGVQLEGTYRGKTYFAKVEKAGIRFGKELFGSPSAAAIAVKNACGISGKAANTDGRAFWKLRNGENGQLVSISALHASATIDTEKLLAELEAWGTK